MYNVYLKGITVPHSSSLTSSLMTTGGLVSSCRKVPNYRTVGLPYEVTVFAVEYIIAERTMQNSQT